MIKKNIIACFGEAEKGPFYNGFICREVFEIMEKFGTPPENSLGINCAIDTIKSNYSSLFFRVKEEGCSFDDYFRGLRSIQIGKFNENLGGISLPGVSDQEILDYAMKICKKNNILLLFREDDFYDYITCNYNKK